MNGKKQLTFIAETKAVDAEKGIFEAMISTEVEDRDGDIVMATGARTENFMRNPVVLFGHDYRMPPVAKALSIEIIAGRGVKSQFQFPDWETSARADEVRRLWAAGFLNAISIGFMVNTWKPRPDGEEGFIFDEWELLEYSIVPVPANQDALRLAVKSLGSEMLLPTTPAKEEEPTEQSQESTPQEGDAPSDNAESEAEPITAAALNDESDAELDAVLDQLSTLLPEIEEVLI